MIALDGPSASGKSTIAKLLSKKLGIMYLSTGLIYRAFGYECKKRNLNPSNPLDAEKVIDCKVEIRYEDGVQNVYLNGENITSEVGNEVIGSYASKISQHGIIREKCVEIQREIASKQSMIVDGRDIGSVVLPQAKYKFYLDADVKERAKRRFLELSKTNKDLTYEEVEKDLIQRDYQDTHRKLSPLKLCDDAIRIDSSKLTIEQVVDKFIEIIEKN